MTFQPEAKTFFGRLKIIPPFKGIVGIIAFRNEFINFLKKPFLVPYDLRFNTFGVRLAVIKHGAVEIRSDTSAPFRARFV